MIFNWSFNYLYLSGGGGACGHQIAADQESSGEAEADKARSVAQLGSECSVCWRRGGEEDGVAELQLWSRHQARGAARHHCRVNQNNAAAANAK